MASHEQCFQCAQRGEQLCREGKTKEGIEELELALKHGTDDVYLLSALYSQLGNAYFALNEYVNAAEYHSQDLVLCRLVHDDGGEANAYSNLAITRVAEHDFDKALSCVNNQLNLALNCTDKDKKKLLSRAYYTKAYVYLQRAKSNISQNKDVSAGDLCSRTSALPNAIREDLYTAIDYFMKNAQFSEESNDAACCVLAYGSLGNAHYILEEYSAACQYYEKRLNFARQLGDEIGMRRAYTSLGNCYFFNSDYASAIQNYESAAQLSEKLADNLHQIQALFSIGVAASIDGDHERAIQAYIRYLNLSRLLKDKVAQSRSCSALASLFRSLGDIPKAVYFLVICYRLAVELSDHEMELKTRSAIRIAVQESPDSVLKEGRVYLDSSSDPEMSDQPAGVTAEGDNLGTLETPPIDPSSISFALRDDSRAVSVPNLVEPLSKFIADCANGLKPVAIVPPTPANVTSTQSMPNVKASEDGDNWLDNLARSMSKRMDNQRCDPALLKGVSSATRQADSLRHSTSRLYGQESKDRRKSMLMSFRKPRLPGFSKKKNKGSAFAGSMGSQKDDKENQGPVTSTPSRVAGRPVSMDISGISTIRHGGSVNTINSCGLTSRVSTPNASEYFAGPSYHFGEPRSRPRSVLSFNSGDLNRAPSFQSISHEEKASYTSSVDHVASEPAYVCMESLGLIEEDRAALPPLPPRATKIPAVVTTTGEKYNPDAILDLIASIQGRRMDEQRADPILPGLRDRESLLGKFNEKLRGRMVSPEEKMVDEKLYDLIMQCQSDRIEDQRSALGGNRSAEGTRNSIDENDVNSIVMCQEDGRFNDQRADFKVSASSKE